MSGSYKLMDVQDIATLDQDGWKKKVLRPSSVMPLNTLSSWRLYFSQWYDFLRCMIKPIKKMASCPGSNFVDIGETYNGSSQLVTNSLDV